MLWRRRPCRLERGLRRDLCSGLRPPPAHVCCRGCKQKEKNIFKSKIQSTKEKHWRQKLHILAKKLIDIYQLKVSHIKSIQPSIRDKKLPQDIYWKPISFQNRHKLWEFDQVRRFKKEDKNNSTYLTFRNATPSRSRPPTSEVPRATRGPCSSGRRRTRRRCWLSWPRRRSPCRRHRPRPCPTTGRPWTRVKATNEGPSWPISRQRLDGFLESQL